jgi:hypothetical protein
LLRGEGAEQNRFQPETSARESSSIAKRAWLLFLRVGCVRVAAADDNRLRPFLGGRSAGFFVNQIETSVLGSKRHVAFAT